MTFECLIDRDPNFIKKWVQIQLEITFPRIIKGIAQNSKKPPKAVVSSQAADERLGIRELCGKILQVLNADIEEAILFKKRPAIGDIDVLEVLRI